MPASQLGYALNASLVGLLALPDYDGPGLQHSKTQPQAEGGDASIQAALPAELLGTAAASVVEGRGMLSQEELADDGAGTVQSVWRVLYPPGGVSCVNTDSDSFITTVPAQQSQQQQGPQTQQSQQQQAPVPQEHLLPLALPHVLECVGIGLVRAVDMRSRRLYLLTNTSAEQLSRVSVLQVGVHVTCPLLEHDRLMPGLPDTSMHSHMSMPCGVCVLQTNACITHVLRA